MLCARTPNDATTTMSNTCMPLVILCVRTRLAASCPINPRLYTSSRHTARRTTCHDTRCQDGSTAAHDAARLSPPPALLQHCCCNAAHTLSLAPCQQQTAAAARHWLTQPWCSSDGGQQAAHLVADARAGRQRRWRLGRVNRKGAVGRIGVAQRRDAQRRHISARDGAAADRLARRVHVCNAGTAQRRAGCTGASAAAMQARACWALAGGELARRARAGSP